ncbi:hypothetical protein GCM10025865_01760 [Paraoerskovia sediminicola]|uniref:Putative Flp pilus-assembly TadG-like N-terminal domain-containing protein n=1 Tax=Paraoerskovia sediminicola TaxID=1138587 RepID=A0ABM8FYR3_9CELL|nr:pilus assembly protein TadG-related protein [Paraoerskovia sediminicola]BDZ40877.1 hypothetical protein GCM10025865_01760 [Paraoerskovia sediminicola]
MLLTTGLLALVLVLVTVGVSVAGVHLDRKRLADLADSAALAAADAVDPGAVYGADAVPPTESGGLALDDDAVRRAVEEHVQTRAALATAGGGSGGLVEVVVTSAGSPDGVSATVTLEARSRPTLISWATRPWSDGVPLHATATARAW